MGQMEMEMAVAVMINRAMKEEGEDWLLGLTILIVNKSEFKGDAEDGFIDLVTRGWLISILPNNYMLSPMLLNRIIERDLKYDQSPNPH